VKQKRSDVSALCDYYLSENHHRDELIIDIKFEGIGGRRNQRKYIEASLWYGAYKIRYSRACAKIAVTILIDEIGKK